MRKVLTLILAIFLVLPVYAQVGRYKNIKLLYPGYSLKLDTATGELSAVHFDDETEKTIEETLLKKQSHNARQVGRYELRRTKRLGTYQVFDTSSGEYITVKWTPKGKNGEPIDANIDSALSTVSDGLKRMLKSLEEGIDGLRERRDTISAADGILEEGVEFVSPTNLIIMYDPEIGKEPLLKAVKSYGAEILYEYNVISGIAIKVPGDILEAIAFFSNVEGVTAVERDHIYHLTDPVKPRMEVL